jgi:hypothetical protein
MALHADLQSSLRNEGDRQVIDHPLLQRDPYHPADDDVINDEYEANKENVDYQKGEKDWDSFIEGHVPAHRLHVFLEMAHTLADEDYASLFASTWCHSDNVYKYENDIIKMFGDRKPDPEHLMKPHESEAFRALPEEVEIFRGYGADRPCRKLGMSWTTSRDSAEFLARHYHGDQPHVVRGRCNKSKIIGYFLRRKESEALINPVDVDVLDDKILPPLTCQDNLL